jgi:hypothetical protein
MFIYLYSSRVGVWMSSIEEIIEKLKLNYKKLFDNYTDKFDKFDNLSIEDITLREDLIDSILDLEHDLKGMLNIKRQQLEKSIEPYNQVLTTIEDDYIEEIKKLENQIHIHIGNKQSLIYKNEVDRGVYYSTEELNILVCYIYYENKKLYYAFGNSSDEGTELVRLELSNNNIPRNRKYVINTLNNMLEALKTLDKTSFITPSGGKRIAPAAPAYKLNGEKVSLLINKKKLHRSVYVRGNGNGKAKYCKINNEFVLLSKLKNKIIE